MKRSLFILIAAVAGLAAPAPACNVPVFRYALERWPADPYAVLVLYNGELTQDQKAIVEAIKKTGETAANLEVETADISRILPWVWHRWGNAIGPSLPLMLIDYPERDARPWPAWWGKLSAGGVKLAVDSPMRRELARRLLRGESAVWVLLESGDAAADAKAAEMVDQTLAKLQKELKLPEPDPDDPRMNAQVPLAIKFTSLRLSRRDPAEAATVSMLLNLHPGLMNAKGPIVFPIFGRGRILAGLTGQQLNPEVMEEAAGFVTGACSCEAKSQNPGVDLLLAADWDGLIAGRVVKDPELPPLIGMSQLAAPAAPVMSVAAPATRPATPVASAAGEAAAPSYDALKRNIFIVVGAGVMLLVVGSVAMRRKSA